MEINANSPEVLRVKQRYTIIGNDPKLINAIERALQVAPIDLSVLIIGESGSGKEFFPQIIHDNSRRKHNKYIAVNCGAIPEGTVDSELFGHEKGSFTGAISSRKGYFEEANGGTIFLDEVAELPLSSQARLLRVLESGEYLKVGSSVVQKTDVRVVAATNKNLIKAIGEGKFREDLYYRLSTVQINVPPLRERNNDINLLVRQFTHKFADEHHTPEVTFTDDAKEALLSYHWPGNVRQLKNVVDQISLFEAGNKVDSISIAKYLPDYSDNFKPTVIDSSQFDYTQERELLFKMIFQMQKEIEEIKGSVEKGSKIAHVNADVAELKRESSNLIKFSSFKTISPRMHTADDDVEPEQHDSDAAEVHDVNATPVDEETQPVKTLEDTERETIIRSLERNCGKRKKTAAELKISERTLYRKIKEYGLDSKSSTNYD
jgi:transcriptional regulator with PAS, ATPase and Fis domain